MILDTAIEEWLEGAPPLPSPEAIQVQHPSTPPILPFPTTELHDLPVHSTQNHTGPSRPSLFPSLLHLPCPLLENWVHLSLVPSQKTQPSQEFREGRTYYLQLVRKDTGIFMKGLVQRKILHRIGANDDRI